MTVLDVQTMTHRMSSSLARQRFSTAMLGAFAVFALILAIVGLRRHVAPVCPISPQSPYRADNPGP